MSEFLGTILNIPAAAAVPHILESEGMLMAWCVALKATVSIVLTMREKKHAVKIDGIWCFPVHSYFNI